MSLKRELGLFETTIIGVGIILGAGIYVLIGKAAGLTGPSVWLSFIIAAIIAAFTGLSYAELSSMFSKDSAEYLYVKKAFKSESLAFLVGWLTIIGGIIAISVISLGFAGYFSYVFKTPIIITAFFIIFLLSMINYVGIKKSAITDVILTLGAVIGLIIIIFLGAKYFGSVDYFQMIHGLKGLFKSASLIFFAYIGFQSIVKLSEETKNPEKTIPKAIILSLIIITLLYVGVAIASVSILPINTLNSSTAPLSDIIAKISGGTSPIIMAILAMLATSSTILALILTTSRMLFGMAEEHSLPESIKTLNPLTKTPGTAIFLTGIGAMFFVLIRNISTLASIVNFTIFLIFIFVNLSLISLRYKIPNTKRPFRTPINIGRFPILPLIAIIISLFMILQFSIKILLITSLLVVLGLVIYEIITKEKTISKGYITLYRSSCLVVSLGLFMIGAFILTGGFLVNQFWWTGILWILLGISLFWYTYSMIFRE